MILGIDTSCYRTSCALVATGEAYLEKRVLLTAPPGSRGFRQSEGLFQHVSGLGSQLEALMRDAGHPPIEAVCVSARPRPRADSYMPVFLAGLLAGRSVAAAMDIPLYETSHQQGHLRAAMLGNEPFGEPFLAAHISGGTSEVLLCGTDLSVEKLGGGTDLHAGQLIDRVGVRLGCGFPAGPEMERLAAAGGSQSLFPTAVKGVDFSFSGAEAQAMRMIDAGASPADVAAETYSLIARTLAKSLAAAARKTGLCNVLLCGGVAASGLLRRSLPLRLARLGRDDLHLVWGREALSGDNAVGVALIGRDRYLARLPKASEAAACLNTLRPPDAAHME